MYVSFQHEKSIPSQERESSMFGSLYAVTAKTIICCQLLYLYMYVYISRLYSHLEKKHFTYIYILDIICAEY